MTEIQKISRKLFGLSLILWLGLAGCQPTAPDVAQARSIQSPGGANAANLDVAVDSAGGMNFIWSEPTDSGSRLVFTHIREGETPTPLIIDPGAGIAYDYPHLATTPSGKVYLVWEKRDHRPGQENSLYTACWAVIQADTQQAPDCAPLATPTAFAPLATEHSLVAANGEVVYAAYYAAVTVIEGGARQLTTRRLDEWGDPLATTISGLLTTHQFYGLNMVVNESGEYDLVVNRIERGDFPMTRFYYSTNYQGTEHTTFITPAFNQPLSIADILVEPAPSKAIDISFVTNNDTLFLITFHDPLDSDPSIHSLLKPNEWTIPAAPQLEYLEKPVVFFTGKQTGTDHYQVWEVEDTDQNTPPGQLTDSANDHSLPQATVITDQGSHQWMVMWRDYTFGSGIYGDVYTTDLINFMTHQAPRRLFQSPGGNTSPSFEVADTGPYVMWAWIDRVSAEDGRLVPWYSFNTNLVFLPLIQR